MSIHKTKFVAVDDGVVVRDADKWYPKEWDTFGREPDKVMVTNFGILYTHLCDINNLKDATVDGVWYISDYDYLDLYTGWRNVAIYTEEEFSELHVGKDKLM